MSINVSVGFQIPTNVVEVGNEISTQQLGAITSGSSPTSANPFTTVSYVSGLYATKASPTFTGTVTIPAGASISGYLTTASASSTYQPLGSYLTDAPSDGSEYVRKNAAWAVATGGGGSYLPLAGGTLTGAVYVPQINNILNTDLVIDSYNDTGAGTHYLHKFTPYDGKFVLAPNGGGLTFPDASVQTTAFVVKTVQACPTTLGAGDQNKINHFVPAMGGSTITIPADSTYAFPNGTEIVIVSDYSAGGTSNIAGQYAGQPTINGAWSVNMSANVSKLVKIGTDIWFYT